MKKTISIILSFVLVTLLGAGIVLAWNKDGGITCQNVFAEIQNDNHFRYSDSSDGYVKYVRTESDNDGNSTWEWQVGPVEGDVTNNAWVEVNWAPPAGFAGDVEVFAGIYEDKSPSSQTWDDLGDFEDYKKLTGHLNCVVVTPSPTPTQSASPSPTPTATPTATPTSTPEPTCEELENCETPVPSETPRATEPPVKVETPLTEAGAPSCPNTAPSKIPNIFVANAGVGKLEVRWTPTGGAFAHIFYGLEVGKPQHSLLNTAYGRGVEVSEQEMHDTYVRNETLKEVRESLEEIK